MQPEIKHINAKKLVGLKTETSLVNNKTLELFSSFMPQHSTINGVDNSVVYDVREYNENYFKQFNPSATFTKWAVKEVASFDETPSHMEELTVEEGLYAVFHETNVENPNAIFEYIFREWLPKCDFLLDNRPHFDTLKIASKGKEQTVHIPIKRTISAYFENQAFPKLTTQRLILRQPTLSDDKVILELRSNKISNEFIEREPPTKIEEAQAFLHKIDKEFHDKSSITWLLELKETNTVIGSVCLWNLDLKNSYSELGYALLPDYFQQGFMSETLKKVLTFGFNNLQLKTIEAYTHKNNIASRTLLIKHNFTLQVHKKDEGFPNNIIYSKSIEE